MAFKDNIDLGDGSPTTGGSPGFKSNIPVTGCTLWNIFDREGVISCGKTNMHELALGTTSSNSFYG
jgi:Asp-tRNA(Asn)/Glu-tRNA(Gln) amidotransferase A subunit family amidase